MGINGEDQLYKGRDVHISSQRIFKGEVDVALVARSLPPKEIKDGDGLKRRRKRSLQPSTARHRPQSKQHASITNSTNSQGIGVNSLLQSYHGRHLDGASNSNIVPGEGWTVMGHPAGYCDGTLNSVCHREISSNCLLSGHNDGRGHLVGDGLSGWLVLDLKDVSEGIFMARMEDWHQFNYNVRTNSWETVNNATRDEEGRARQLRRRLKEKVPEKLPTWRLEGQP